MTSEVLDLGRTQISYEFDQKNTDSTVTMIHCFGSNKKYWDFHKKSFMDYNSLIIDVPGHGQSKLYNGPCTLSQIADDIVALLDHLGIQKIHLGGVSMGGMISQTLILKYPDRVASLMLINTTCFISEDMHQLWEERSKQVLESGTKSVHDVLMRRWFTLDAIEKEIPGYKYLSATFKSFNPKAFKKISEAMCGLDTNDKLKSIDVPTLIIATPDDPGAPTHISRRMADFIRSSELHWLEPAQHLSSLEHVDAFNEIISSFLYKQFANI